MKAKYYIGILSALVLSGMPVKAQYAGFGNYSNVASVTVTNNYHGDYDYYYSSRINRFHRSYVAFNYYSPVFTETYWYSYSPYTWGASIYRGGLGFNLGYNYYYPLYYGSDYFYDYGWYDPFFSSSYYRGYEPYYAYWYTPVIVNLRFGNRWDNHYRGWNGHNHMNDSYWRNGYRPVFNDSPATIYSTRNSTRNSTPAGTNDGRYQSGRSEPGSASGQASVTRRDASTSSSTQVSRTRPQISTNTGSARTSETRRSSVSASVSGGSNTNQEATGSEQNRSVSTPSGNSSSGRRESTISQTRTTTGTESNSQVSGRSDSKGGRRK